MIDTNGSDITGIRKDGIENGNLYFFIFFLCSFLSFYLFRIPTKERSYTGAYWIGRDRQSQQYDV